MMIDTLHQKLTYNQKFLLEGFTYVDLRYDPKNKYLQVLAAGETCWDDRRIFDRRNTSYRFYKKFYKRYKAISEKNRISFGNDGNWNFDYTMERLVERSNLRKLKKLGLH